MGEGALSRGTDNISTSCPSDAVKISGNSSKGDTETIPQRYRTAVSSILHCSSATTRNLWGCRKKQLMRNDKLKSTTVRFTESDLQIIACLQDKLGLGMVQVIRLAIRRLAEIENVLTSPAPRKKG